MIDASIIARLIMLEGNYVEAAREIKTKTIMTFPYAQPQQPISQFYRKLNGGQKGGKVWRRLWTFKTGPLQTLLSSLGEQLLEVLKVTYVEALGDIRWHCLKRSKEKNIGGLRC